MSPFVFEKQTCSNANRIANITIPTTANINSSLASHIPKAAAAIAKLCKNPPSKCDFNPMTSLPGVEPVIWFKGDEGNTAYQVLNHADGSYAYTSQFLRSILHSRFHNKKVLYPYCSNSNTGTGYCGGGSYRILYKKHLLNYTVFYVGLTDYLLDNRGGFTNDSQLIGMDYYDMFWSSMSSSCVNKTNGGFLLTYNLGNSLRRATLNHRLLLSHSRYDISMYIDPVDILNVPFIIVARYCEKDYCPNYDENHNGGFSLYFYNKNGLMLSNHRDSSHYVKELGGLSYDFETARKSCGDEHNYYGLQYNHISNRQETKNLMEYIVYDTALDDKDIFKVVEYLSNRWFTNVCP